jgi:hypothetical protein
LAEAFSAGAWIALPESLQKTFMIFVMAFPCGIVATFFLILWFRPVILYAPSDYDDSEDYLIANKLRNSLSIEAEKWLEGLRKVRLSLLSSRSSV